jgi:hypothetical protein
MTTELSDPGTNTDLMETISAFIDGERIEPDQLKRALELPEGRDYLVDLLTLREAISGMGPVVSVARKPRPVWTVMRGTAAAAIVLLALAGGYAAGLRVNVPVKRPAPRSETQIIAVTSPSEAPKPTRVIKLEPGVNWADSKGAR